MPLCWIWSSWRETLIHWHNCLWVTKILLFYHFNFVFFKDFANCEHMGLKHNCVIILRGKNTVICKSYTIRNFHILCDKILEVWGQLEIRTSFKNIQNPKCLLTFQENTFNQELDSFKIYFFVKKYGGTIWKTSLVMCNTV